MLVLRLRPPLAKKDMSAMSAENIQSVLCKASEFVVGWVHEGMTYKFRHFAWPVYQLNNAMALTATAARYVCIGANLAVQKLWNALTQLTA